MESTRKNEQTTPDTAHGYIKAKDKEKVKARRQDQDGGPSAKWPWVWYLPGGLGMSI